MTDIPLQPNNETTSIARVDGPKGTLLGRLGFVLQFFFSIGIACGVLAYLYFEPGGGKSNSQNVDSKESPNVVEVVGQRLIRIEPDTAFSSKLDVVTCKKQSIHWAMVNVTGKVVASLRSPDGKAAATWQFHTPEALTVFTDWQKAQLDIAFYKTQLEQVKTLAETRVKAQERVVERIKKTVDAGTNPAKDLALEKTKLLQDQIQGNKEVYEAKNAVRIAERQEASKSKELEQAGLDTALLKTGSADTDIVVAEIPEVSLSLVRMGQMIEANFVGLAGTVFRGKINRISPVISPEQRSLRILFVIFDPEDKLRPGMYARIDVGTDPRDALVVPSESVIHTGRSDYALVATDKPDVWRVTDVQVGEPHSSEIEIRSGLQAGERVLGKGVILLKPTVIQSLTAQQPPHTTALRTAP